jgi:hypothetical protein
MHWQRHRRQSRQARCQSLELARDLAHELNKCILLRRRLRNYTVGKELSAGDNGLVSPHRKVSCLKLKRKQAVKFQCRT